MLRCRTGVTCARRSCSCRRRGARAPARGRALTSQLLRDGAAVARADERRLGERPLPGLLVHPACPARRPAVRARPEHVLGLLRVRHRQDELGPALVLRRPDRRDGPGRDARLRRVPGVGLQTARALPARSGARSPPRATRWPRASVRSRGAAPRRSSGRSRRTRSTSRCSSITSTRSRRSRSRSRLSSRGANEGRRPDDVVSARRIRRRGTVRRRRGPRGARAGGGGRGGLAVRLPDFGLAYGDGIAQNLRRSPWRLGLVPAFVAAYARAARAAARGADLVHAHWIPSALPALATGKPYVLQVWGTDVELFRRASAVARPLVRRARARDRRLGVPCRRGGGARRAGGERDPVRRRAPGREPGAGRAAARPLRRPAERREGDPRVRRGDGRPAPRDRRRRAPPRPGAGGGRGSCRRPSSARYYERAAVFCVAVAPRGLRLAAREAMAHGRPVVATRVGGLADLRGDGVVHVGPRDIDGLRAAVERLLADPAERARRGAAAAATAAAEFSAPLPPRSSSTPIARRSAPDVAGRTIEPVHAVAVVFWAAPRGARVDARRLSARSPSASRASRRGGSATRATSRFRP